MPKSEEDWAFFTQCVAQLQGNGYAGHVSFEGGVFGSNVLDAMLDRMKRIGQSIHA